MKKRLRVQTNLWLSLKVLVHVLLQAVVRIVLLIVSKHQQNRLVHQVYTKSKRKLPYRMIWQF